MKGNFRYPNSCRWGLLAISVCFIIILPIYSLGLENKYPPLIITMIFSPIVIIIGKYKRDKNLLFLASVLVLMFVSGRLLHPESFRIDSYVYTIAFFSFFLSYDTVIQKNAIPIRKFEKFLRFLIYAYAIVLLIQQTEVLVGITEPINIAAFGGRDENRFKLNSLAMEPSNVAIIMPCVMFCWMKVKEIFRGEKRYIARHIWKEDLKIWIAFLYTTLGCGSMTAFFSVAVTMLYFVNRKNLRYLFIGIVAVVLAVYVLMKVSPKMNERIGNLFSINYSSPEMIASTDASSATRIVPFIIYFQSFGFNTGTLVGHGMDALEYESTINIITSERILNDERVGANSMINTFYDYGFLCGLLFLIFILRNISPRFKSFETLFYFLIYIVLPMNHFVLWGFIFCMMTVKKYNIIYRKK